MPVIHPGADPVVRFDDAERSAPMTFRGCRGVFRAETLDEVRPSLAWAADHASDGAWVAGMLAYDASPAFDDAFAVPAPRTDRPSVPLAWFAAFEDAELAGWDDVGSHSLSRWSPGLDRAAYDRAFSEVHGAIRRGDTYQANLTFPLDASFAGDPRSLYLQLLESQDVGYAAYLDLGDLQVASVSPERFFSIEGRTISLRPMKGTRSRGRWRSEDEALVEDLRSSEKDRAENLMIVDLIRNDVGRIATTGTVVVDSLFAVEEYRTVWQMTSDVSAHLRPDIDLSDVFTALFPCGSVTGAPKASTMEIITGVESVPRGVYCGAIGVLPPGDGLDGASFSVAIRTAVVDPSEGRATYGVGGGVTWDSNAADEYHEALAKATTLVPGSPIPGLFETVRHDGEWVLLEDHLDRIEWSAARHGIAFDRAVALASLEAAVAGVDRAVRVRLAVGRNTGMSITVDDAPDRFAMAPGPAPGEVGLGIDMDPVDPQDPSLYVKTTDRRRYEDRRGRHRGVDDVLLINTNGLVTESTVANVAALIGGRWYTPPLSDGLLPGILRGKLVDEGLLVERSLSIGEVLAADGVALVNSVRGWRPARVAVSASAPMAGPR